MLNRQHPTRMWAIPLTALLLFLGTACSASGPDLQYFMPTGSEWVITADDEVRKTLPDLGTRRERITMVVRVKVTRGGTLGRDTLAMSNRVERVIVDEPVFGGDGNKVWDSNEGPPDEDAAILGFMHGVSYDLVVGPGFETQVSNLKWPGLPASATEETRPLVESLRKMMTPQVVGDDFVNGLLTLPRGRHAPGSTWQASVRATSPFGGVEVEQAIRWTFANQSGNIAELKAVVEGSAAGMGKIKLDESSIALRHDVVGQHPLEQSIKLVAELDVNGRTMTYQNTQSIKFERR